MPPGVTLGLGARSEVTVGVDIGTSSVKAVAVDARGAVVARARVRHPLRAPSAGQLEHDAVLAWWEGPRRALAALGELRPAGVAVSAMVPSMAAVERSGRPLSPGLLYGDERGRLLAGGGGGPDPSGRSEETAGMLAWLAREVPDAAAYWQAQAVANAALGGPGAVDLTTAWSAGKLYDLENSRWDPARCRSCGVEPGQLPSVVTFGESLGEVSTPGPAGGAVLAAGGVDVFCEQLVADVAPGEALVICGSTLLVWAVGCGSGEGTGLWRLPGARPGEEWVGGASNAGGIFLDWVDRVIRPCGPDALGDPRAVPVWWPYIRGERVPLHDPDRRAGLAGVDLTHGAAALRRAAYEASAFAARHILELAGALPARIVATGGGSAVGPWMQALADVLGARVDAAAAPEGAARGAAWLARMGAGLESSVDGAKQWAATGFSYEPDERWAKAAEERYMVYLAGSLRAPA